MRKSIEKTPLLKTETDAGHDVGPSSSGRRPSKIAGAFSGLIKSFSHKSEKAHDDKARIMEARREFSNIVSSIEIGINADIESVEYKPVNGIPTHNFDKNTIGKIENAIRAGDDFFSHFTKSDCSDCIRIIAATRIVVCGARPGPDSRIVARINGIVLGLIDILDKIPNPKPSKNSLLSNEVISLLSETVLVLRGIGLWAFLALRNDQTERTKQIRELVSGKPVIQKLVGIAIKHGQKAMEALLMASVAHPDGVFNGRLYLSYMLMHFFPNKARLVDLTVEDFDTGERLSAVSQPCSSRSSHADLIVGLLCASVCKGDDAVVSRVNSDNGLAEVVLKAHGISREKFPLLMNLSYTYRQPHFDIVRVPQLPEEVWQ